MAEPTAKPTRKVTVGAGMTALSTLLAWAAQTYGGVEIPTEVGIAGAGFLTFCAQYVIPDP